MNAVERQRRSNARRIAAATAPEPHLPDRPQAAEPQAAAEPRGPEAPAPDAVRPLAAAAYDRADALSGAPVAIDLLAAADPLARVLVALAGQPVHGHVVLGDDATAVYTSAPGYTGTDSFGYRLTDAEGRVVRVTVTVSVAPQAEPASGRAVLAYAA